MTGLESASAQYVLSMPTECSMETLGLGVKTWHHHAAKQQINTMRLLPITEADLGLEYKGAVSSGPRFLPLSTLTDIISTG